MRYPRMTITEKCSSCSGDGLYKRHTSYTVNGKPICFRCEGSGEVTRKIPSFVRLYEVRTLVGKPLLVPAAKRKFYIMKDSPSLSIDEIPF